MKIRTSKNLSVLAALLMLSSLAGYASDRPAASVSASIQATARVVASQGIAASRSDVSFSTASDHHDRWLWITEDENLQVQVMADGLEVESCLVESENEQAGLTALARHRYHGLVRRQLQVDSLPMDISCCTITVVNTAN